jgi:hypothetical protein
VADTFAVAGSLISSWGGCEAVTDNEWLECTDPKKMMQFLMEGTGSDRQLRLFGCACCRQVWELLTEDCFRGAVEVAELFADGHASSKELAVAKKVSGAALERNGLAGLTGPRYCALGSAWSCTRSPETAAMYPLWVFSDEAQRKWQLLLLRDIFGKASHTVPLDATSLTPNVTALAQTVYDERKFHWLHVLADALEEAGCTDTDIIAHCRQPGEHVRGCWVVDLLLGKE